MLAGGPLEESDMDMGVFPSDSGTWCQPALHIHISKGHPGSHSPAHQASLRVEPEPELGPPLSWLLLGLLFS